MANTIWVCPINGLVPADNGSNPNFALLGTAVADPAGNPPHCPICGSAMHILGGAAGVNTVVSTAASIATPVISSVTPTGTAGSTTYGYKVTAVNSLGETVGSAEVTTTTGNATLSGTNYNAVTWGAVAGATSYNVYGRTAGSEKLMKTGVAGTTYNDTGADAPGAASPPAASTALNATPTTVAGQAVAETNNPVAGVGQPVVPHTFALSGGNVTRGTATVTPETLNSVVGP